MATYRHLERLWLAILVIDEVSIIIPSWHRGAPKGAELVRHL
jgi:hypothetical protein